MGVPVCDALIIAAIFWTCLICTRLAAKIDHMVKTRSCLFSFFFLIYTNLLVSDLTVRDQQHGMESAVECKVPMCLRLSQDLELTELNQ